MIEADFAKFVDQDDRARKGRILQKPVEKRRFACAEKARQDRHRDWRRRSSGPRRLAQCWSAWLGAETWTAVLPGVLVAALAGPDFFTGLAILALV